ncbi:hypothetical protein H0A36_11690 [Endozoicomonas sp. SM1973]|uniref:Tetratricopeptide repeat protein n=1 Tax=Spartinivicinus marinus TaxID=2994442 RepID=A0A853I522_9GAMM|nr:hypothetical protein [Spartinivicinus marinus]MCX4027630.1 hypothetical protein [Spartinivicinus marinus]NYZ66672.1 hypothetical protein [Spartinivicinus marinus]
MAVTLAGCQPLVEFADAQQTDDSQPEKEQSRLQTQIAWLLLEAEDAFKERRLTTPEGDNALGYYREVIRLQPDNVEANQGVEQIVEQYFIWAHRAATQQRWGKASEYLEKAQQIKPDHPGLKEIADLIKQGQSK